MKHHPKSPVRRESGFTLVELLVTISIILILAVLSSVGFSKYSRKAKAAGSLGKVRDIGVSVMTYASDAGALPVWHDYTLNKYWWQLISDSEGTTDLTRFKSPGHQQFDTTDEEKAPMNISYGWNYLVSGRHKGDRSMRVDNVMTLANFPDPSTALMVADGPAVNSWGYLNTDANKPDPLRYEGKAAAVFVDGSARMLDTPQDFTADSKYFIPIKPLQPR
jgi:prepilin-type N-terminal cleavage/methylation domain-containing protein